MSQYQPARHRMWIVRHKFLTVLLGIAVALVALAVVVPRAVASLAPRDYHDTVQLAQAVKNTEQAKTGNTAGTASCGKYIAGKYYCVVVFPGGSAGSYTVTVSADGRSWSAS